MISALLEEYQALLKELPAKGWEFWAGVAAALLALQLSCLYLHRSRRVSVAVAETTEEAAEATTSTAAPPSHKYRFRKRDKLRFYGQKILRQVNNLLTVALRVEHLFGSAVDAAEDVWGPLRFNRGYSVRSAVGSLGRVTALPALIFGDDVAEENDGLSPSRRHRKRILPQLNKLFRKGPPPSPNRPLKQPPRALLSEFHPPLPAVESSRDVYYVIRNMRVFGHFEGKMMWEMLQKNWTEVELAKGEYLFRPGDPDESIFIVSAGQLVVNIHDGAKGLEYEMKKVGEGEALLSLLSVLDVLTGHQQPYKTVSARALERTKVVRLSVKGFRESFDQNPEEWVKTVQMIVLRLLHVTITTLHNYLGLSKELSKASLREHEQRPSIKRRHHSGGHMAPPPARLDDEQVDFFVERPTPTLMRSQSSSDGGLAPPPPLPSGRRCSLGGDSKAAHLHSACQFFLQFFELPNSVSYIDLKLLDNRIQIRELKNGEKLTDAGSTETYLFVVQTGVLELRQDNVIDPGETIVDSILEAGEVAGGLPLLSGDVSFFDVRCKSASSRVAMIHKSDFYVILGERPRVILPVAHSVVFRLSPFLRAIDHALDWEMCESGRAVFGQGSPAAFLYVVLSGRFRSVVVDANGQRRLVEENGKGDMLGVMEVFHKRAHVTDMIAIRYSEVAKIPTGVLDYVKIKYPQVLLRMMQLLGQGLSAYQQRLSGPNLESLPNVKNLHTIAILPVNSDVPVSAFSLELTMALTAVKPTLRLSSALVTQALGETIFDTKDDYRLLHWINTQEDTYEMLVYVCDTDNPDSAKSAWTDRCLRQADCILIVAMGESTPCIGQVERQLEQNEGEEGGRAQKELILLWPEGTTSPSRTAEWLDLRAWVSSHHHIRCAPRMFKYRVAEDVLLYYEQRWLDTEQEARSDFARLARLLTGNSIGLVLGGGGARGASHIGVLKAMDEAGIPVDIVAGVSIGSLMGGLFCDSPTNWQTVANRAWAWFRSMTWWRFALDWTPLSATSSLSGWQFNQTIKDIFEDKLIEDLWLPYFCVSTDITSSEMKIHRNGPLWAYIRASMSLAGFLPPICDPQDGHLLLDGGYVNNVPADVMRSLGVRSVIAVDVGAEDEREFDNYGDYLPGWWSFWNNWKPFGKSMRILNMSEIQSRLAYVSCIRQLEIVKKASYCHYLRPPIAKYGTTDFWRFETIFKDGYDYGKGVFNEWEASGQIADLIRPPQDAKGRNFGNLPRPAFNSPRTIYQNGRKLSGGLTRGLTPSSSLTDLAAAVSKVQYGGVLRASESILDDDAATSGSEDDWLSDVAEEDELADLMTGVKMYRSPVSTFEALHDDVTQEEES